MAKKLRIDKVLSNLGYGSRAELKEKTEKNGLYLIPLVAPTSHDRIKNHPHYMPE